MVELWLAFSAGLAGSLHCLGMCGGIVSALSFGASPRGSRLSGALWYHSGRIMTYTLIGGAAAALSGAGLMTPAGTGLRWIFLSANLVVVALGVMTLCGRSGRGLELLDGSGGRLLERMISGPGGAFRTHRALFPLGLAMGLIPCGMVYGVMIASAAADSWLLGGGMMLAFGAGTLPALLTWGHASSALTEIAGTGTARRLMGAAVALLAGFSCWKMLNVWYR